MPVDPLKNCVLLKGRDRTLQVESVSRSFFSDCSKVVFRNSPKTYTYSKRNVEYLASATSYDGSEIRVTCGGKTIENPESVSEFASGRHTYYHVAYDGGRIKCGTEQEISIVKNVCTEKRIKSLMDYFKRIAKENTLEFDGVKLLARQYEKLDFLTEDNSLATYLDPVRHPVVRHEPVPLIFPFGCNRSQRKAVWNAFTHSVSLIQGPPGTGKTQTILNIIANIVLRGQSVLVVSNNNTAVGNIHEKLEKEHLGFLSATLGSCRNKQKFTESQKKERTYPSEVASWRDKKMTELSLSGFSSQYGRVLKAIYKTIEAQAAFRSELSSLRTEADHNRRKMTAHSVPGSLLEKMDSNRIPALLNELQIYIEMSGGKNGIVKRIIRFFKGYRLKQKLRKILPGIEEILQPEKISEIRQTLVDAFYSIRERELETELKQSAEFLSKHDTQKEIESFREKSMRYLKAVLSERYSGDKRPYFSMNTLNHIDKKFLKEYPVVTSTTFSARSMNSDLFDYVIIDEASQVSSETGVLALSCASNAVIVGDSMQLPNVLTAEEKKTYGKIHSASGVPEEYNCAHYSLLDSAASALSEAPQTLLMEHYRCDPLIIGFCNSRFYGGKLIPMTRSGNGDDAISVVRTVPGNHARGHFNQREVDTIAQKIIPRLQGRYKNIGVIAPYNAQVDSLKKALPGNIDISTVHGFQGRECDAVILSCVDNRISRFVDDPHMLNVAVSRAKKKFCLVVSGNPQPENCHISDLIDYVNYHDCSISESPVCSVFDYLYSRYSSERRKYLSKHRRISEYDSENLTYALLEEILTAHSTFRHLGIICHQPLKELLGDLSPLEGRLLSYASHPATHIDFLIYNRVSKQPVLEIGRAHV